MVTYGHKILTPCVVNLETISIAASLANALVYFAAIVCKRWIRDPTCNSILLSATAQQCNWLYYKMTREHTQRSWKVAGSTFDGFTKPVYYRYTDKGKVIAALSA